jgi:hypothetical protein
MSGKSQAGKGSKPRPYSVRLDDYGKSWDRIFGKKPIKNMPKFDSPHTVDEITESEVDDMVNDEEKERAKKIKTIKPLKTKRCPHCATFNLIHDIDRDDWLLCKKCGWNDFDPYKN